MEGYEFKICGKIIDNSGSFICKFYKIRYIIEIVIFGDDIVKKNSRFISVFV